VGWDVLIFKLKDPSTRAKDMDQSKVLSLGDPAALRNAIDAVVPGIDWSNPTWGYVKISGCHLEFNLKGDDQLSMGIHVHGHGDPITPIVALCKANGWVAFDTTAADFLDLESPSDADYKAFRGSLAKVIEHLQGEDCDHRRKK
jgi:hypothetical protein